jgi:pyruvate dehydrogenase E2 component (dihydrolipoamide acetyltransferase)
MEQGTIVKWHKKEGEFVEAGDLLFEVATDKATVEHNALDAGWLRKVILPENSEASVNQAVAIFTENKDESIEGYKPEGVQPPAAIPAAQQNEPAAPTSSGEPATPQPQQQQTGGASTFKQPAFAPEPPLVNYQFALPTQAVEGRIKASPLARSLAKEQNLDLSSIKGSGPGGRIMRKDLSAALPKSTLGPSLREAPSIAPGTYVEEPLNPVRKVIAQRLQEAKTFIPHFYVTLTIDAEPMVALREQLAQANAKVSFNDIVVRGSALALRNHPVINSGFNTVNNTITRYQTIDISIAVSIPDGLITPVVHHADYKSVSELSVEIKNLVKKARDGKLQPQEYKGGSLPSPTWGCSASMNSKQSSTLPKQPSLPLVGS